MIMLVCTAETDHARPLVTGQLQGGIALVVLGTVGDDELDSVRHRHSFSRYREWREWGTSTPSAVCP
ncbi:MAG: hypothetical protein ABW022_03920 [Actinoplanes sp.]